MIGIYRTAELAQGWGGELIQKGMSLFFLTSSDILIFIGEVRIELMIRGPPKWSGRSYDGSSCPHLQYLPYGFPTPPKTCLEGCPLGYHTSGMG